MARVLLTGGRAPVALELARLFARAGHEVHVAESLGQHLCRNSRAVARHHDVPPPRQRPMAFLAALERIVTTEGIDLLLPTCEEIFHVARGRERLARRTRLPVAPLATLDRIHNKWTFVETCRDLGLAAPATRLVTADDDVPADPRERVFKPAYGRFAARTIVRPRRRPTLGASADAPWLDQEYVAGGQLCTWTLAEAGRIVAHADYATVFTAGVGSTLHFAPAGSAAARRWVEAFVGGLAFDGQLGIDFIERPGGEVVALEANPRATSGVHLFAGVGALADALLGRSTGEVEPSDRPAMIGLAMILYALPAARTPAALARWWRAFRGARDVIHDRRDPLPAWLQLVGYLTLAGWALVDRTSILAASTRDIEYNGPP